MVVDSERTFREFTFNMCYYNYHLEPPEQEPGKKKKKKKKNLEPMSVDEGRLKNLSKGRSSVDSSMVCSFYSTYRRQDGEKEETQAR